MSGHGGSVFGPARAALVLGAGLLGCSPEAEPAPTATTESTSPALTAADLEALMRTGQHDAVVAAAPPLLESARQRGDPPARCWAIEAQYVQALLIVAPADQVVARWQADSAEFAEVMPPDFLFRLSRQARNVDPSGELGRQLIVATHRDLFTRIAEQMKLSSIEADIYGHPEGFPKAWLAPDERPVGWPGSER